MIVMEERGYLFMPICLVGTLIYVGSLANVRLERKWDIIYSVTKFRLKGSSILTVLERSIRQTMNEIGK